MLSFASFRDVFTDRKMKINIVLVSFILFLSVERTKNQNIVSPEENVTDIFLERIVKQFGSNGTIDFLELDSILSSEYKGLHNCFMNVTNLQTLTTCLEKQCVNVREIFQLYSLDVSRKLTVHDLEKLSPALLYSVMKTDCGIKINVTTHSGKRDHPSQLAVWGFGMLFVALISVCSLIGVIVLPCMKMSIYRLVLVYMVALAVGSLAGSGLLFLIPEAFSLVGQDDRYGYIWRSTSIMGGIYLFYLTERIMRILVTWRENKLKKRHDHIDDNLDKGTDDLMNVICSVKKKTPESENAKIYKEPNTMPRNISTCTGQELLEDISDESLDLTCSQSNEQMESDRLSLNNGRNQKPNGLIGHDHSGQRRTVKPVAWMIIFGDGLHNFIDGLSIGAAFSENILTGISVSVAVICEELPHELGDFAILLNSGMSLRKALLFNFLSACMCFLGLIFGILLGELSGAHHYVFGVAGGMFLYISLADMMPEMNAAETTNDKSLGTIKIFILQNLGLLTGFGIMLFMAVYSSKIQF